MALPETHPDPTLSEEERLRELLTYALGSPRAGTAARVLLETLGSLDGVFTASEAALAAIEPVGPEGARLLRLMVDTAALLLEERSLNLRRVYDTPSAVDVLRPRFTGRSTEAVAVLLLDARGRAVYQAILCEGDFTTVPLRVRDLLRLIIDYRSTEIFLAHNHPSGMAFPSQGDLLATQQVMTALRTIEATLCDHIIFAGDSWYSFAQGGVLPRQRDLLNRLGRESVSSIRRLDARIRGLQEGEDRP